MIVKNPNLSFIERHIKDAAIRYIRLEGGTRSGKTWSFLEFIIGFCYAFPSLGIEIAITRKTLASLKSTALKDFLYILKDWDIYTDNDYNKTDHIYRIGKNTISFFGADNDDKLRGFSCDILYCNEALELSSDEWLQLKVRTRGKIIIDYNPSDFEHYLYDELDGDPKCVTLVTTYKDNPHLPKAQIQEIEKLELIDPQLWSIYGQGKRGTLKGLIFSNWNIVYEMPQDLKKFGYGLDFGFTNDPTALIEAGVLNGEIWVNELIYERGLTNSDISERMNDIPIKRGMLITADSSEPKSIEEIKRLRHYIKGVEKKQDSVRHSINALKQYKINVTASSTNLIKEFRSYKWKIKDSKDVNEPIDKFNHAIDALRYWGIDNLTMPQKRDLYIGLYD
jgi:phage terminase large subunit